MDKYEQADEIGRNILLKYFKPYIKYYKKTEKFSHWDLDITGKTDNKVSIEIKVCGDMNSSSDKAKYFADNTGYTTIKKIKVEAYKNILVEEPNRIILFAMIYCDGLVLYDLSHRIKEDMLNEYYKVLESKNTVYNDSTKIEVEKVGLKYQPELGDKIYLPNYKKL